MAQGTSRQRDRGAVSPEYPPHSELLSTNGENSRGVPLSERGATSNLLPVLRGACAELPVYGAVDGTGTAARAVRAGKPARHGESELSGFLLPRGLALLSVTNLAEPFDLLGQFGRAVRLGISDGKAHDLGLGLLVGHVSSLIGVLGADRDTGGAADTPHNPVNPVRPTSCARFPKPGGHGVGPK